MIVGALVAPDAVASPRRPAVSVIVRVRGSQPFGRALLGRRRRQFWRERVHGTFPFTAGAEIVGHPEKRANVGHVEPADDKAKRASPHGGGARLISPSTAGTVK